MAPADIDVAREPVDVSGSNFMDTGVLHEARTCTECKVEKAKHGGRLCTACVEAGKGSK